MDIRTVTGSDIFTKKMEQLCLDAKEVQQQLRHELQNQYADKLAEDYTSGFLSKQRNQFIADFVKRMNRKLCQNPLSNLQNLRSFIEAYQKFNREMKEKEDLTELTPLFKNNSIIDGISIKFFKSMAAKEKIIKLEISWLYALIGVEREARLDEQNIKDSFISKHENELLREVHNAYPNKIQYCEEKIMAFCMQILWDEKKMGAEIDSELSELLNSHTSPVAILENLQTFFDLQGEENFSAYKSKMEEQLDKVVKEKSLKSAKQFKDNYWIDAVRKALENRKKQYVEKIATAVVDETRERVKAKFSALSESTKACIFRSGDNHSMREFLYFDRQRTVSADVKTFDLEDQSILFICRTLLVQAAEQLKIREKELFWNRFIRNHKDRDAYYSNSNLKDKKDEWYKKGYENPVSELMVDALIEDMLLNLWTVENLQSSEELEKFIKAKIKSYFNVKLKIEEQRQENHASSHSYKKMMLLDWEKEIKWFAESLANDFKLVIKAVQGVPFVVKTGKDMSNKKEKYDLYQDLANAYQSCHASLQKQRAVNSHAACAPTQNPTMRPVARNGWFVSCLKLVVTFFAVLFCCNCSADSEEVTQVKNESKKSSSRVKHVSHVDMYKSMGLPGKIVETQAKEIDGVGVAQTINGDGESAQLSRQEQGANRIASDSEKRFNMP